MGESVIASFGMIQEKLFRDMLQELLLPKWAQIGNSGPPQHLHEFIE